MRDAISIERAAKLHPAIRQEVIDTITATENAKFPDNISVRIVQGLRTFAEQQALYEQGRTKPGKRVTNSKAGQSYHNFGLAIDFSLLYDKDNNGIFETLSWDLVADLDRNGEADWMEVVDSFEALNYTWGGRFHSIQDNPHIEKTFGMNWRTMLQMYNNKIFIPGTEYIKL